MKQYIFGFLLLILSACGQGELTVEDNAEEEEVQNLEDNFTISGVIENAGGQGLYLEAMTQNGVVNVASTQLDGNGKFKLVGNIPALGIYQLRLGEASDELIALTLMPEDNITLKATKDNFVYAPQLSGGTWTQYMTEYTPIFAKFHDDQEALQLLKGKITDEEMQKRFVKLKKPVDAFCATRIEKDPGNPYNIVLSSALTPQMGFEDWDPKNMDLLNAMAAAFEQKYPGEKMTEAVVQQTAQVQSMYDQFTGNSGLIGKTAPEIALPKPDGSVLKLSSLRGKYVLIDFWASWCGPCRKENPNVIKEYKKYKNKNFTILSVSLDENKTAWIEAIAQDGLIWPNHVSDLSRFDSPLVEAYQISGIPHTVLVDPKGKIVEIGLRGASLEQKLKELLTK